MQKKSLIAAGVAAGVVIASGLSLLSYVQSASKECVSVHIDYGVLDNGTTLNKCVPVDKTTGAIDVLKNAGITLEGTDKYGSQIVCRVNSLPSSTQPVNVEDHTDYVEACTDMPPAYAYWAVLIQRGGKDTSPLDPATKWGWAETGIDQVKLDAGDSIGLVFADNEKIRWPE